MDDLYAAHYAALGLRPGAKEKEIRSAYRRLVKLYHPDRDKSLDAQMRYREIRAAYDVLRNRPDAEHAAPQQPRKTHSSTEEKRDASSYSRTYTYDDFREVYRDYGMSGSSGWKVRNEDGGKLRFFGWTWDIPKAPPPKVRKVLSWKTLPGIVGESVDEIVGVQMLFRIALTCWLLWTITSEISKVVALLVILLSLGGSAVFRYYYTRSPLNKGVYFLASLYYGMGMSVFFIACSLFLGFRLDFLIVKFIYHTLVFYTAILPLWVHPLLWAAVEVQNRRRF